MPKTDANSDSVRYAPADSSARRGEPKNVRLLTLQSGGWVLLLAAILMVAVAAWLAHVATSQQRDVVGDGVDPATHGFDLERLAVPRERLQTFGQPRDFRPVLDDPYALPALVDPRLRRRIDIATANWRMRGKYVVPDDRVVAVEAGGEARAYPLRILAAHEIVNDTLGGVPIVVTYSPMADIAVVFDRRVTDAAGADETLTFGLSGLMVNDAMVMYDRRFEGAGSGSESLWWQPRGAGIAGPYTGARLRVLPSQLIRYTDFVARHTEIISWTEGEGEEAVIRTAPTTPRASVMVVDGIGRWARGEDFAPVLDREYRHFLETYRREDQTDDLLFPVEPLPAATGANRRLKERVIAVRLPGEAEPTVVFHRDVFAAGGEDGRPTLRLQVGDVELIFVGVRGLYGDTVAIATDPTERLADSAIVHAFHYAWYAAQHLELSPALPIAE